MGRSSELTQKELLQLIEKQFELLKFMEDIPTKEYCNKNNKIILLKKNIVKTSKISNSSNEWEKLYALEEKELEYKKE